MNKFSRSYTSVTLFGDMTHRTRWLDGTSETVRLQIDIEALKAKRSTFSERKKILCDNILFQTQKLLVLYPDNCNWHLFRCLVTWHIVQAVSGQNIRKLTSRLWRRSNQLCMKPSEKRHSLRQHRKFKLRNFCTLSRPLKLAELQLFPLLHISTTKRRFSHCGNMRCFNKTHRMNPWYGYDTSLCK